MSLRTVLRSRYLIDSDLPDGSGISIGPLIMNDGHTLLIHEFTNLDSVPVTIRFSHSLYTSRGESFLCFQSENPVLAQGLSQESNELFHSVYLIDHLILPAHSSKSIIMNFRGRPLPSDKPPADREVSEKIDDLLESQALKKQHRYFNLNGSIYLSIVKHSSIESEILKIPFSARMCISALTTDREISFDECVIGETYVKDFTIWNRSEVETTFLMVPEVNSANNIFEFSTYEFSSALEGCKSIPGFSNMRMRIHCNPTDVGEFRCSVKILNRNDFSSSLTVVIRASVSAELHRRGIDVSETVLDFGDCYVGKSTVKKFTVTNVTSTVLTVHLDSSLPEA
eukprot:8991_1